MDLVDEFTKAAYELNEEYEKVDTTKYPELNELFNKIYNIYFIATDGRND